MTNEQILHFAATINYATLYIDSTCRIRYGRVQWEKTVPELTEEQRQKLTARIERWDAGRERAGARMRRDKKDIEEVSRQRIAIIRQDILRELIVWTLREAHRIVLFRTWWALFHWLVYKREQKYQEGMKLCKRCEKLDRECWHPFEDFYKNVKDKHGLSDYCSKCCNELCAATREKNPEAARERKREWYKMHPEKMLEYRRRAYAKNPKRYNRATRKWQRENAERWNAYNRAYRARKKAEKGEEDAV